VVKRSDILQEAESLVNGNRDMQYGTPEENFTRIADLWTVHLGIRVMPHDVAAMMILMKVARLRVSPDNEDTWIDLAGYAACGGEVARK
jgi:hypothetical protein